MKNKFVYFLGFMQSGTIYIKIGVSEDVNKRKDTLQTALPFELKTFFIVKEVNKPFTLEKELHKFFTVNSQSCKGEWFRLLNTSIDSLEILIKTALADSTELNTVLVKEFKPKYKQPTPEEIRLKMKKEKSLVDRYCTEHSVPIKAAVSALKKEKLIGRKFIYPRSKELNKWLKNG